MSSESFVEQSPIVHFKPVSAALEKLTAEDEMNPSVIEIEVDTIDDVINDTGLSPDALDQYRVLHSPE